jgi:hypothetical protein
MDDNTKRRPSVDEFCAELRRTRLDLEAELEKHEAAFGLAYDQALEGQQAELDARERRAGLTLVPGGLT